MADRKECGKTAECPICGEPVPCRRPENHVNATCFHASGKGCEGCSYGFTKVTVPPTGS